MNQYGSRKQSELTYEQKILLALEKKPQATKEELIAATGASQKTITEYLSKMKREKKINKIVLYVPPHKKISLKLT